MSRVSGAAGLAVVVAMLSSPGDARADVVVRVDKSSQRMSVMVNGEHRYTWTVSTGIYGTPSGSFRPQSLARYHRSTLYNNAPMPYSIFYDGNFAIHGTTHVAQLGGRASRGCVRLQLQLAIGNRRARAFYERLGFGARPGYELLDKALG